MHFVRRLAIPMSTTMGSLSMIGQLVDGRGVQPQDKLRRFDAYGATLVTKGTGVFRDEMGRQESLRPGSLILTLPGVPHWFGPHRGQVWDETYFVFSGPAFDLMRGIGVLVPGRRVLKIDDWEDWHQRALDVAHQIPTVGVMSFVGLLLTTLERDSELTNSGWLSLAKEALARDLDKVCDLDRLSTQLGMGYDNFRRRFKQEVGVPPSHFRTMRRLELSCELLVRTDLTLEAIALRTGYADAFTFSKAFHRAYNAWPSVWRVQRPDQPIHS